MFRKKPQAKCQSPKQDGNSRRVTHSWTAARLLFFPSQTAESGAVLENIKYPEKGFEVLNNKLD